MIYYSKRVNKAFTLLELILVIVIIGILVAVAIPRFTGAIKMAKEAEAENILGSLRSAQLRYYVQWGNNWASSSNGIGALDVDIVGGKYYSPALPAAPADSDIAHANTSTTGLSSKKIAADGTISDQ